MRKIYALLAITLISLQSYAVETTSDLRGKVLNASGSSVVNASVTVTYEPTNSIVKTSTNDSGSFVVANLKIGGPYKVLIVSGPQSIKRGGIYLSLGKTYNLSLSLNESEVDEMLVTAKSLASASVATGPSVVFGIEAVEAAITYDRDIKELIQSDPRLYIDDAYAKGIQCNGQSPRYNGFTVDGMALNDGFGLNGNGYPTNRMPFSYDSVQQVSAEFAPFDVQYGGFSSCVINAVTKSGSNELHGNVFVEYASDSLQGDEFEDTNVDLVPYDELKYGFTAGGPLVEDKLFYFVSYERYDDQDTNLFGPQGSGLPQELGFLSQSMYNRIIDIANNKYGFDPGGIPSALDSTDDKFFLKLDYYLNESTRAVFSYNYNDGFNINSSDASPGEFEFDKHFYERGHELNAYSFKLYSNITDNFNTEFRLGYRDVENRQIGLGGPFGDFQIDVFNPTNSQDGTVYLGGTDDSRQANQMNYDNVSSAFVGEYLMGNNLITFGLEYEKTNIYNLFMQHSLNGEWDFNSIDDFDDGIARVYFGNTPSLEESKAAADWGYKVTTFFLQNEMQVSNNLEISYGLRYDKYGVDGKPQPNNTFIEAYGYTNTVTYDGADALMPRLAFSYQLDDSTKIYGGYGAFSGGNPNVWYSNMYSNDGVTAIQVNQRNLNIFSVDLCDTGTGAVSSAGPGLSVPCSLVSTVQSGTANTDTNSIAPDFDIPLVYKTALGIVKTLDIGSLEDVTIMADVIYAKSEDAAVIKDINVSATGQTDFAGVPYYNCAGGNARSGFTCYGPFDFQLANANKEGKSKSFSVSMSKYWDDYNLYASIGFADIETEDVMPMTSSVAFSNYTSVAVRDPNNPDVAISNYNIPQRFTGTVRWSPEIFNGLDTKISIYWNRNKGRPYSYVFDGNPWGHTPAFTDNQLLYVPTGPNDPNVIFGSGFDTTAFFAFVDAEGLSRGEIVGRNEQDSDWYSRVDMKIIQELPAFIDEGRFELYLVMKNLTNFLNSDWGVYKEAGFPRMQKVVKIGGIENGKYEFDRFSSPRGSTINANNSLWQAKIGLEYKF